MLCLSTELSRKKSLKIHCTISTKNKPDFEEYKGKCLGYNFCESKNVLCKLAPSYCAKIQAVKLMIFS